jgi:hypothetical protein
MQPLSRVAKVLGFLFALVGIAAAGAWALAHVRIRLEIDDEVAVRVGGQVPFRLRMANPLAIKMDDAINARVKLEQLEIPLDETLRVPLKLDLEVPIDTQISVQDQIEIALDVPINMVLTERELDLSSLEVPLDTDVMIDDSIDVDIVVPIDTQVTTLLGVTVPVKMNVPIKTKVPIRQKVHVHDMLKVPVRKLHLPFHAVVPIKATLPIAQSFHVKGLVRAPIRDVLSIPIKQTVHPKLDQEIAAVVHLDGQFPAQLQGELNAEVALDQPLPTHVGALHIDAHDVAFEVHEDSK